MKPMFDPAWREPLLREDIDTKISGVDPEWRATLRLMWILGRTNYHDVARPDDLPFDIASVSDEEWRHMDRMIEAMAADCGPPEHDWRERNAHVLDFLRGREPEG